MKEKLPQKQEQTRMHEALILANVFFGIGAVVGAIGLPATHPLTFALIREFWAGLILLGVSIVLLQQRYPLQSLNASEAGELRTTKNTPSFALWAWVVHWKSFAILGMVVFGNQSGFIVGIKMAGPVTASIWQPSQPIFTTAICMALGWEPVQHKRLAGVFFAFFGCLTMILLKGNSLKADEQASTSDQGSSTGARYVVGNALFFCNCLCTSLYVILSKRMLALYPPLLVTAWSYNFASVYMLVATLMVWAWPDSNAFFCPECPADAKFLEIPGAALPALLYYIIFASVGSYGLITWANQHATGTLVMSYAVLQPVTAVLLTTGLLTLGAVAGCTRLIEQSQACLEYPSMGTFCGMLGVFCGLALIISTEPSKGNSQTTGVGEKDLEIVRLYENTLDEAP